LLLHDRYFNLIEELWVFFKSLGKLVDLVIRLHKNIVYFSKSFDIIAMFSQKFCSYWYRAHDINQRFCSLSLSMTPSRPLATPFKLRLFL
jgi:hypothetical protein